MKTAGVLPVAALTPIDGASGNACTHADFAAGVVDRQTVPLQGASTFTVADFGPAVSVLKVYDEPFCGPSEPVHEYVAPFPRLCAPNTSVAFWHTVSAEAVMVGVLGKGISVTVT